MEAISLMKTPSPGASPVAWSQRGVVLHFVASMVAEQGRRAPDGEGRSNGEPGVAVGQACACAPVRLRRRRAKRERSGGSGRPPACLHGRATIS
jgi:hypothetical protein